MADLSSASTFRGSIYAIYSSSTGNIVYVGKTTWDRDGTRFQEHVRDDSAYPWHYSKVAIGGYDSSDETNWPFYPRKLFDCKDYTELELAAAEQYYWEQYGGLSGKLKNSQQPLTKATFFKYKSGTTWSNTKGFPPGWSPKV